MGSNPVSSGKGLAEGALIATSVAASMIPVAWAAAGEMYKMQSDPGAMFEAGEAWLKAAGKIGDAVTANENLTNSIAGTGWEGEDYKAFTDKAADLSRQLMIAQGFAYIVGVALITMAIAIFLAIIVMVVMGAVLAVFAALIFATMASVIGFAGPLEALELDAEMFALECESNLIEMGSTLTSLSHILGGTITAFLAGDVGIQSIFLGNDEALGDLGQATVDGLGTIATGLVAALYQGKVGKYMKTPYSSILAQGLGITDTITGGTIPDKITKPLDKSRN
jgi:hypothetical protein